jgi:hypothetical protein
MINKIVNTNLNEVFNESRGDFLKWKRKNVTLRGVKTFGSENNVYGSFGKGLYTTPLSNKQMAKEYGQIYFVVNAIPKNPKIVYSLNDAEIFRQNLINTFCKAHGQDYSARYFEAHTSIEKEMQKIGYDGLIIKGREMINYNPQNIKYFKTESELINYFNTIKNNGNI